MNVIDLFAGAGGLSEGFRQEGHNILAHVEMDKHACTTLKTREAYYYLKENNKLDVYKSYLKKEITRDTLYEHIPENVLNRVINKAVSDETNPEIFEEIDELLRGRDVELIIGGPPCQAYSVAGRSRDPEGMRNDPRNYLYQQYISFLRRYQPNYFVFENVLGLLSAGNGSIFENIQEELRDAGYEMDFRILNSRDFGVLQSRRRIIIIGWREGIEFNYPHFETLNHQYTIRDLFQDLPVIKAGEEKEPGNQYLTQQNNYLRESGIKPNEWDVLSQHIARPNRDLDLEIYRYCVDIWNRENRKVRYNELPQRLITHRNTDTFLDRFNVVPYEEISHTVVAHIAKDGHYYIHPDINQNRSISVREAARIQSFPDDYYFESSRTAAYKQIGNAVPPLMARKIARSLINPNT
ncbi:DNA cytosine methyltransferase [Rossellomorea marisflavi]|uniref:DNA cytosine methyltransferase n=1 Tax=Rossellomorea marisflavi TaxID=189381 RepID=UPI00203E0586|nr:DNA cytosine methyltransferase [Rossellomorea marisflavi]MCM2607135.1 DNA cytosine methyltransferase [Rossellomorea marisflavi]